MTFTFHPITQPEKQLICGWRYPAPYHIYNLPDAESYKSAGAGFYNPDKEKNYYTYYNGDTFIGYTNFSEKDNYILIGIGLRPEHCGKGYGKAVLSTACRLCKNLFTDKTPALQVRSWNKRAIRCYEKAGFATDGKPCTITTPLGTGEFIKMIKTEKVKDNQQKFLDYTEKFAAENKTHIILTGSFRKGNATDYSDIDIIFCNDDIQQIKSFIYGYSLPVYISHTTNPPGIIIVIYGDGVALDIEIAGNYVSSEKNYFHRMAVKENYVRNTALCKELSFSEDESYLISRLFHRSIIKYLSGKTEQGISILNEISSFLTAEKITDCQYKNSVIKLLNNFRNIYTISDEYSTLLNKLIEYL